MARTNVEDDWFIDKSKRRAALIRAIAQRPRDLEKEADGYALDAWRTAQDYWKNGQLVPEDVWERSGLEPLIEVGLAERQAGGVYVRGSKEHLEWIAKKARGGKKRAQADRNSDGTFASSQPAPIQQPASTAGSSSSTDPAASQPLALAPAPALALAHVTSSVSIKTSGNPQEPVYEPVDKEAPPPELESYGEPVEADPKSLSYSPQDLNLARAMHRKVLENPEADRINLAKPESWANELRLMRERDRVDFKTLITVLTWVFGNDFWSRTIQSPSGLRKNWQEIVRQYNGRRPGYDKSLGSSP